MNFKNDHPKGEQVGNPEDRQNLLTCGSGLDVSTAPVLCRLSRRRRWWRAASCMPEVMMAHGWKQHTAGITLKEENNFCCLNVCYEGSFSVCFLTTCVYHRLLPRPRALGAIICLYGNKHVAPKYSEKRWQRCRRCTYLLVDMDRWKYS